MKLKTLLCSAAALLAGGGGVALAATTTGYEDFGDVAGVVLWRATQTTFHNSTVADVAADGTVGEAYAMLANNSAKSWQRFASNQTAYSAPGMLLVYDKASSDDETPVDYTQNSEPDFGPMSFGGLWVQTLAANGSPFKLADGGSRATEFGNASYSGTTLFKFEKSFTIDRQGQFSFLGTVNLAVAQDAVFTINPLYPYQNIVIASGSTLAPSGAGSIVLNTAGLTVNGTLDLTASTLPTISGNVRFASGSSLVLPAGVATGEAISVDVCSGTLTADGVVSVKIGDAAAINAALTVSGGAITQIDEAVVEQTFTSDYPSVVPAGYIYTFTTSAATTLPDVTVNGTLKTEGDFTITDLKVAAGGALEVVSGNTTVGGAATCQIKGNVTVDAGATLTNTLTDSLDYNGSMTVTLKGTLAMGSTRWSIPSGCTFNLYAGASVTGTGDTLASLDIINANGTGLNVYAGTSANSVTIEGPVRVRANETRIWVAEATTLVLQGGIVEKNQQSGSFKQTGPGTLEICATQTGLTGGTCVFTQGNLILNNTSSAFPVTFDTVGTFEVIATDAATTVPVNVTLPSGMTVSVTGDGKVSGNVNTTYLPADGDLKTFLASSAWTGSLVIDGLENTASGTNLSGLGNNITLNNFKGFLYATKNMQNVNLTVTGTFKQTNGWSDDNTRVFLASLSGDGTLSDAEVASATQLYEIRDTTGFTGTFNFTKSRILVSGNAAPLTTAQTIKYYQVDDLTVNGGSLTGTLNTLRVAVTTTEEVVPGMLLVQATGGVQSLRSVTVNGEQVEYVVKNDGIYVAEEDANVACYYDENNDAYTYYTSMADAISGCQALGRVITLLANVDEVYELAAGARPLKVKLGDFTWTGLTAPDGYQISSSYVESTGVTTYTCVEAFVAKARIGTVEGQNEYATVDAALQAAIPMATGTVVYVLDATYVRNDSDANLLDYFSWDASARTFTLKAWVGGEGTKTVTASTESAALAAVTILPSSPEVQAALNGAQYSTYFMKSAVDNGDGTWTVTVALNKEAILDDKNLAAVSETETIATVLAGVLNSETQTITFTAKSGLYYSFAAGDEVGGLVEGDRVLATAQSVTLDKVADATFYQVQVHAEPKMAEVQD